jgi:hypothetical protein
MPIYSISAPNGKTYQIDGPEGATQDQVQAQVLAQFPDAASVPTGAPDAALRNARPGRYKPAALPARKPVATPAPKPYGGKSPQQLLQIYSGARQQLAAKVADPAKRAYALSRFDSDPRMQALRKAAGLAPLSTRQNDVRAVARKAMTSRTDNMNLSDLVAGRKPLTDVTANIIAQDARRSTSGQGFGSGFSLGAFGLPQMLAAAGLRYLPSSWTGNKTNLSYSQLKKLAERVDQERFANHPAAGVAGMLTSSVLISRGAGLAGGAAAASRVPAIARTGNVLQNLATLKKGQKLANAAKLATIGGAAGGLQAAGTGEDIPTGIATGAIAAPGVAGGVKVAQVITRPFRDVLRLSSAGQILSRLTTATRDSLERKAAAYRAATGAEPTLFELLPLADRNKILKQAVVGKDNIVEQTSNAIRRRAQNLGPEMSAKARAVLQPNRDAIEHGLRTDLANARGGALAPGDDDLIANAMESHTDMRKLRGEEAAAIMAPHDATPVVPNLEDLFPSVPGPSGTAMATDPEVSAVIRSAAGTLRARPAGVGITAGDITDMISTLKGDLSKGGIEGRTADRAIKHLHDMLDTKAPDAGAAARRMSDAYAARSRMMEGMKEGAQTRLRNDVYPESRAAAQKVENAYDTPEGATGRTLGQGNRVISDLGGSPEEALRATVKQSRGSTGRQLAQNVGPVEADLLSTAAHAQDESAQALASASQKAQSGSGDGADAEMLVQAIAGLHPSSFITTKAGALRKLFDMTYIPEGRARAIVDMIFSQDPKLMRRALKAIGNEPNGAKFVKYLSGIVGQSAANATGTLNEPGAVGDEPGEPSSDIPSVEDDLNAAEQPAADEQTQAPATGDSPYAPALESVYQNENPELIDLIQRVKHQEHGVDAHGNFLTSPAGAVGPMQVMPDTGPEAAQLAGLPWDENAYRTDAAYNELLGIAYLSELLRKYDGDVSRALAAYNAGQDGSKLLSQNMGIVGWRLCRRKLGIM